MHNDIETFLEHHGVLGMKWGVRRNRKNRHEDYQKVRDKKKVRSMSDAELRSRINRFQMEKQYKELTQSHASKGKKVTKEILGTIGKTTLTTIGTAAAMYAAKKVIAKKFGPDFANAILGKKK